MTFFYFHTLICLPDELPPQSDVPMCIYYLPSLLILSFYIILLLQQFQKLFFRKRLGKIIALDHLDSPAADLFHFFLCFHPFGNNMIIHFMKCFYNTFIENCPFLIPADIKSRDLSTLITENGSLITVFRFAYPEPKSSRHKPMPASVNSSATLLRLALYSVATVSVISNCIQLCGIL